MLKCLQQRIAKIIKARLQLKLNEDVRHIFAGSIGHP